ncbi:MAG: Eco57I restriction-modification methylase domain-containing protein [Stellaceae bacterium]
MLVKRGGMFLNPSVAKAKNSAKGMLAVEALTDADIAEARRSAATFAGVEEATAPLARFMNLVHAFKWLDPEDKKKRAAIEGFYDGQFGDPVAIAGGEAPKGKDAGVLAGLLSDARALTEEQRFLHWEVAFPGVWTDWESREPSGGFDAVIGNPPWDRMKLQEVEWFATRRRDIAMLGKAADRKKAIAELEKKNDPIWDHFRLAASRAEAAARVARETGQYPLLARGDIDLYALFVERSTRLLKPTGICGLLVPSGIASDLNTSVFFREIANKGRLAAILDFWNKRADGTNFFPDVYYRFKFCVFVTGGRERNFDSILCGFYLRDVAELADPDRVFPMSAEDFSNVNPNTGTVPIFRSRRDAKLTRKIFSNFPVLVDRRHAPPLTVWPLAYRTMFHMANDSSLFRDKNQLQENGFYLVPGGYLKRGPDEFVPLYEGKMVQAYDHRAADIVIAKKNLFRPGQTDQTTPQEHSDPAFFPTPRYYVDASLIDWPATLRWSIAFKDITSVTNARTIIAALIPFCGAGHTLPLLIPDLEENGDLSVKIADYKSSAPLILANLNSFAFDFFARQKVQGNHLTWFIVEQLPFVPASSFETQLGRSQLSDLICDEILRLTYTAHDMEPFARDMGYQGQPFEWNEEDRRHRRARLDALFFRLYGVNEDDAAYILDTFPIVREHDEAEFGRYRTKDLVLGYMRAIAAGDVESRIEA